jgi:hypothetical protein
MFRYSLIIDSLLKAMTHKYVRRIPKGVTKTGKTKYVYFYAGQEGHGKGIGHESELVQGSSFAFGEGAQRHHAHITKTDGDKITVKYDDGDKKGTEETMTKKQFQALVHGEHATGIKQAQAKAEKQLKDFQAGKEKGTKVKQSTLDKLEQRVKNLDELTAKKEETQKPDAPIKLVKDHFTERLSTGSRYKQEFSNVVRTFEQFVQGMRSPSFQYKPVTITEEMISGTMTLKDFKQSFRKLISSAFVDLLDTNKSLLNSDDMLTEFGNPYVNDFRDNFRLEHGGIFAEIEKKLLNKDTIASVLLDIAKSVEDGMGEKDISKVIEKKFVDMGQKFIEDAKEKQTAPQNMVKVKPIKPSEQNVKDLVTSLYSFADKSKGHRLNSITINPKTKTIFATNRSMALIVTNPKAFEFSDDIKNDSGSVALNPIQIANMKKTKSSKIVLDASNTDEGIGFENKTIESVLENTYDNNKEQKTMNFTEDLRNKLASLKDYPNAKVVFSQSPTDKTRFDIYHRFGAIGNRKNVKIGDVTLGQGGDRFADEFALLADDLKQVLPIMSKIYIPDTPTTAISFDGNDENTRGLLMPINVGSV